MSKLLNVLLVIILVVGCGLLLYPTVSDISNKMHQTQVVVEYEQAIQEIDQEAIDAALESADNYNQRLFESSDQVSFQKNNSDEYDSLLNLDGSSIMGYVDIPTIRTTLPIYHGTEENVLQVAVGHLEWTSLPIGGENTHSVLSGHSGLPSAKLFTDLDLMGEGDIFTVHILEQTLYYEVDQITIVLPEEASSLVAEEGGDYCTLLTCTPYGINSHRLLVRGHRIYPSFDTAEITDDLNSISPIVVSAVIIAFMIVVEGFVYYIRKRAKAKKAGKERI